MAAILVAFFSNPVVQTAIVGILTAAVSYGSKWLVDYLKEKTKGTRFENVIGQMTTFMEVAVLNVEQKLLPVAVAAMADGRLTAEEKTNLQQAAWNAFVASMGGSDGMDKAAKKIGMTRGQFDVFAVQMLEALVYKLTKAAK